MYHREGHLIRLISTEGFLQATKTAVSRVAWSVALLAFARGRPATGDREKDIILPLGEERKERETPPAFSRLEGLGRAIITVGSTVKRAAQERKNRGWKSILTTTVLVGWVRMLLPARRRRSRKKKKHVELGANETYGGAGLEAMVARWMLGY